MTTPKHTPGPWAGREYDENWHIIVREGKEEIVVAIANNSGIEDRETMLANARLIAAAPDLLDILEEIVIIQCQEHCDYRFTEDQAYHCARSGCDFIDYKKFIASVKGE